MRLIWKSIFGLGLLAIGGYPIAVISGQLPDDEMQLNLNTYLDSYGVNIVYPSLSISKRMSESTSFSGRYLVDIISAASMQTFFEVDGITSATTRREGGGDDTPDELRQETGIGVTHLIGDGTVSLNTIYSAEHDYSSKTLAASTSYPIAMQNTTLQMGLVKSWDDVHPQTRFWNRDKNVVTYSTGLTQVIGRKAIAQLDFSYTDMSGFLSDPYQVVSIVFPENVDARFFETIYPDSRVRRAAGGRVNLKTTENTTLQLGYRYYWDSWEIISNTFHGLIQKNYMDDQMTLGLGLRSYSQGRAFFFQPVYREPQELMAVDSKLDEGDSREYKVQARVSGTLLQRFPFFDDERTDLSVKVSYYHRHTTTADWYTGQNDLYAWVTSFGYRYRF